MAKCDVCGNDYDMVARRFASDGSPITDELPVNTYTTGMQAWGSVAVAPDGGFVVTWLSDGQDGSGFGVYAQQFSSEGTKIGEEIRVNERTNLHQDQARVAVDNRGNFVAAFGVQGMDGSGRGVAAGRLGGYSTALYESETTIIDYSGGETATITSTVVGGAPGAEELLYWRYQVVNNTLYAMTSFDLALDSQAPDGIEGVANVKNSMNWDHFLFGSFGQSVRLTWLSPTSQLIVLPPGGRGDFSFTTPATYAIGHILGTPGPARKQGGQVLGPAAKTVVVTVADFIPVNGNNDNGSVVTREIPAVRDFNFPGPMPLSNPNDPNSERKRDLDLKPVTVSWTGPGGYISVSQREYGLSRLKFWTDEKKTSPFSSTFVQAENGSFTFFVEGREESMRERDVAIKVVFQDAAGFFVEEQFRQVSVTPVLNPSDIVATGQPVSLWLDEMGKFMGFTTFNKNANADGIEIDTPLIVTGVTGTPSYIQLYTKATNGPNGAYIFAPGTWLPLFEYPIRDENNKLYEFPFVDADPPNGAVFVPDYDNPAMITDNGNGRVTVHLEDSPEDGFPLNLAKDLIAADVRLDFESYVVWRWGQPGSGVIYTLAKISWSAYIKATRNNNGVWAIANESKVTVTRVERSHEVPPKLSPPVANEATEKRISL